MNAHPNGRAAPVAAALAVACAACAPAAVQATLPAGTELAVAMTERVSSGTHRPGDPVEAVVVQPVIERGRTLVPAGTVLTAIVIDVVPRTTDGAPPRLGIEFTGIHLPSGEWALLRAFHGVEGLAGPHGDALVARQGTDAALVAGRTVHIRLDAPTVLAVEPAVGPEG